MTGKTSIEWATAVWNPTTGCTRVSAGCDNCYAFALHDKRFASNLKAAKDAGAHRMNAIAQLTTPETIVARARTLRVPLPYQAKQYDLPFSRVQLLPDRLDDPLRHRKPERYFVDSMADLFHEDVPDEFIDKVFAVMGVTYWHTFLVLTKRPARMRAYMERVTASATAEYRDWPRLLDAQMPWIVDRMGAARMQDICEAPVSNAWPHPNVWLGTSVEDQKAADERIPHLLETPAVVRFLSCEPLIGPVDLDKAQCELCGERDDLGVADDGATAWCMECEHEASYGHWMGATDQLDWVIVGGESGPRARPMDLAWARSLVEQCRAAGVAPVVKQLGSRPVSEWPVQGLPHDAPHHAYGSEDDPRCELKLRDRKGGDMAEWPEDLRIREFPARG